MSDLKEVIFKIDDLALELERIKNELNSLISVVLDAIEKDVIK